MIPFAASSCLALKVSALSASPKEHLDVSVILSQLSPTPRSSPSNSNQPLHKQTQASEACSLSSSNLHHKTKTPNHRRVEITSPWVFPPPLSNPTSPQSPLTLLPPPQELPATDRLADPQRDALYAYPAAAQKSALDARPWLKDPRYFTTVRISSAALLKMVTHARSGGAVEVMGLMQGYVDQRSLIITDAFRLPVEGTETRVNAQDEANEYMVEYLRLCRDEGRAENVVGWYHSHPGYGCWLSGIDVGTQAMQQQWNDPFVAVVVDPDRTVSAGKVEVGAFRTFPENYKPTEGAGGGAGEGNVPLAKVDDFGAHANRYYALEVEHFRSTLDSRLLELLWNKYWVQTLAQNPLLTNRDFGTSQLSDLGMRVREAAVGVARGSGGGGAVGGSGLLGGGSGHAAGGRNVDKAMDKIVAALDQIVAKEEGGLMAADVKAQIFGGRTCCKPPQLVVEAKTEGMDTEAA